MPLRLSQLRHVGGVRCRHKAGFVSMAASRVAPSMRICPTPSAASGRTSSVCPNGAIAPMTGAELPQHQQRLRRSRSGMTGRLPQVIGRRRQDDLPADAIISLKLRRERFKDLRLTSVLAIPRSPSSPACPGAQYPQHPHDPSNSASSRIERHAIAVAIRRRSDVVRRCPSSPVSRRVASYRRCAAAAGHDRCRQSSSRSLVSTGPASNGIR